MLAEKVKEIRSSLMLDKSKFSRAINMDRLSLDRLERGTKSSINIDDLFVLIGMGLELTPVKHSSDGDLESFEKRLNEDGDLMSRFYGWLKNNKKDIEKNYVSGALEYFGNGGNKI